MVLLSGGSALAKASWSPEDPSSTSNVFDTRALVDEECRWMVLHTRSRQEKAVARHLRAQGYTFYLPLADRVSINRGRKLLSQVPLFPNYLFAYGTREITWSSISCKRVCNVIDVPDQANFVHELEQIAFALEEGGELDLYPFAVEGRRCRVRSGPFHGLEGTIVERKTGTRLVLQVGILGRGAELEIDIDLLEPLDD